MAKVTLMNFGDATRVFFNAKRRPVSVGVGEVISAELDQLTEKKIKSDKTIVLIPDGASIHHDSPQLHLVLETLREFSERSYDDVLNVVEKVMGDGAMGPRPTRAEMRMELARRAALAAHYVQKGAAEEAATSLRGPAQRKIEQAPGPTASPLETTSQGLIIKGDEDDEDDTNSQESNDGDEGETGETGEEGTKGEGKDGIDAQGGEEGQGQQQDGGPDAQGQGPDGEGNIKGDEGSSQGTGDGSKRSGDKPLTKAQRRAIARAAGKRD